MSTDKLRLQKDVTPPANAADIKEHLRHLELLLLDPAVRRDRARMTELLADDFVEFGSSGRAWTRSEILDLLESETQYVPPAVDEFRCSFLAEGVALLTYRTRRADASAGEERVTLRSSIWVSVAGQWRIRFHQGTAS